MTEQIEQFSKDSGIVNELEVMLRKAGYVAINSHIQLNQLPAQKGKQFEMSLTFATPPFSGDQV